MKRIIPFKNGLLRPSACSYSNANISVGLNASNNRRTNMEPISDSIYLTPTSSHRMSYLNNLMFAPRKKKPSPVKRRYALPGSSNDCRQIRKRLDFDTITTNTSTTTTIADDEHEAPAAKRKLNRDPLFAALLTNELELAVPFSDMQVTPKTTKKIKCSYDGTPTPTPTCSKKLNFNLPCTLMDDDDERPPIGSTVKSDDEIDFGETPVTDSFYRVTDKTKLTQRGGSGDGIPVTPVVSSTYPFIGKPEISSGRSDFTKISDASNKGLFKGSDSSQKTKILSSKSVRNLSLMWQ